MIIIGITGTIGAGKGTIVEYLKNNYNFTHYSARDIITEEIIRRGLPVNREVMVEVANDIRSKHNPGFIIEELYNRAVRDRKNAIIESIRTLGEIEFLAKKDNFFLLSVDAEPEIRYARIKMRRSSTDNISFEQFLKDNEEEFESSDPNRQNILACMKLAKFKLTNDGSREDLERHVDGIMSKIKLNL